MINKNRILIMVILSMTLLVISGCSSTPSTTVAPPNSTATTVNPPTTVSNSTAVTAESKDKLVPNYGAQGAKSEQNLTLEKMLVYAIQDEYLAHAEYDYILNTYGNQKPFNNIKSAEEKHIESLSLLFRNYKIALPQDTAIDYIPHPESLEESLKAGVQAEIENIAMYEYFIKQQLPDDVRMVFVQLNDGSKGHLNAFERSLGK